MSPLLLSLILSLTQGVQEISLVENARWGGVDGPGAAIGEVKSIAVLPDGGFAVVQSPEPAVRLFSPEGAVVADFGWEGMGPGEFRNVAFGSSYGDTLLIGDPVVDRTTLTVGDSVVATWPSFNFGSTDGLLPSPVQGVFSDRSRLVQGRRISRESTRAVPLVRLAPDGDQILNEITTLNNASDVSMGEDPSTGLTIYVPAPVGESDLWVQVRGRDLIAVLTRRIPQEGREGSAVLTLYDPDGQTVRRIEFNDEVHPVPPAAYEREIAYWTERAVRGRPFSPEQVSGAVERAIKRHPVNPLFDRLVAAEDGRLWLRRGSFGLDTAEWIVVSLDGVITSRLFISSEAEIKAASEQWVWTVEQGDFDETYVVKYAASPPLVPRP